MPHTALRSLLAVAVAALPAFAHAQPVQPLTMEQIMADPDWIGPGIEDAWWRWDGKGLQYLAKRDGGAIRDTWQVDVGGGTPVVVDGAARANLDASQPVYDAQRSQMAFIRNDDVFVRDLRSGKLAQLTRTSDKETRPQWGSDGALVWKADNSWYRWTAQQGSGQAAVIKADADPDKAPKADDLRDRQLRTIATLQREYDRRQALRQQDQTWVRTDPTRAPAPVYMGKDVEIVDSSLSPNGQWLLVVTSAKDADAGRAGKMPKYVTESGYEETQDTRVRVGHNAPVPHTLWLVDMASGKPRELKLDGLPGITDDPLAAMRKAAGKDPLKGNRAVQVMEERGDRGSGLAWSNDSRNLAVQLRAVDNKDRWLATVDLANASLHTRHRLTDPAWINWDYNDYGWMPDHRTLWLLSEQSGYSHLYTVDAGGNGKPRALTSGKWEVSQPKLSADGRSFLFTCNRNWPGDYELCKVPANGGSVKELTSLKGVETFDESPDGSQILLVHSSSYVPPQLAVMNANGDGVRTLTDTRKPGYKAFEWLQPEYVKIPSKHGAGNVWGKYYGPKNPEPGRKYPVVMFVHGAGYLQNVDERYPNYFREQMFHNMLVQQGYVVLDLDYRASKGYGRDWRTAIYRWMGKPELEDYLDGLDWVVRNKQGDRDHAGIYGGSYGGFMTFVALFKQPGVFKAGAALRPVADWSQYNHEYTSNILNTPELDPEAFKRSSPIEFADGLQDNLLIAHGMIDDNVFFKDSVMMTQKLIELRKRNWEVAPYPMERHGFVHPDSWYDEYRRIHELFERTLKPAHSSNPAP